MINTADIGGSACLMRHHGCHHGEVQHLTDDVVVWEAGFDGFFVSEYPRLVRLLCLVVEDPAVAEELAQDSFADLVRRWRSVSTSERPDAWLRTVSLDRARRRDRQLRLRRALRVRGAQADSASGTGAGQARSSLSIASGSLTLNQRAIVGLHTLEGRSVAESAEILGRRPAAASADLADATVVLAGTLGGSAGDAGLEAALRDGLRADSGAVVPDVDLARRSIAMLEDEHDSRRRFRFAMVGGGIAAVALLITVLNHPWTTDQHDVAPLPTPVPVSGLYGLWRADVAGADRRVLVTLAPSSVGFGGFTAYPSCGEVDGALAVTSLGSFAAAVDGRAGRCSLAQGAPPAVEWLEQAVLARPAGQGWTLIDVNGHPLATLRPAKIAAFPHTIDLQAIRLIGHVPPLPAGERATLDRVVSVPADAVTATANDVVGTWHPSVPSRAFMTFYADGSYAASDGWHCSAGRWAVDPVGQLAFAPGLAVNADCPRPQEALINLPQWFADADVLGADATHLLLFDDTGRLLRTVQENAPAPTSS